MIAEIKLRRIAAWAAGLAGVLGLLSLIGWWLKIDGLRSLFPGGRVVSPNTALSFFLSGMALWLMQQEGNRFAQPIARFLAILIGLRAASNLLAEAMGRDFGLSFLDIPGASLVPQPGGQIPDRKSVV